ncbi:cytochrome P450 [Promicromonospora sp. NPDC057138]|uniref:cytochrome P450 n=1 Tax=Promicromonospora sp. NPDC057138 TaxID=3346031 RepID=UPI00362582D3
MTVQMMARDAPIELVNVADLTPLTATTSAADPQAVYGALLKRWGVVAPVEIEPGAPAWLVMGHTECMDMMRNERLYSRDPRNWRWNYENLLAPDAPVKTFSPDKPRAGSYHHDGETRRRLREPLDAALAALPQKDILRFTERVSLRAIDALGPSGTADLVRGYASQVGFLSTAAMLGVPDEPAKQLMRDSALISTHRPGAREARERIGAILMNQVQQAKASGRPGTDLIAAMVGHPNFKSDKEVVDSVAVPLHAASMFLGAWIARILHVELSDARLRARWTGGRIGLEDVMQEVLWRDTHVANSCAPRYAMEDVRLGDILIRKGDAIVFAISAANHDPRVHTGDPWDEIGNKSHISWGTGPHACPAPRQALLITRTAVQVIQQELDLTLTIPADAIQWAPSPWVRQPLELPVQFKRVTQRGTELPKTSYQGPLLRPPGQVARPMGTQWPSAVPLDAAPERASSWWPVTDT